MFLEHTGPSELSVCTFRSLLLCYPKCAFVLKLFFLQRFTSKGDDGYGHMTKKYMAKIENFLTFGQRNLDRRQIEKLKKENERKERVGRQNFSNMEI